MSARWLRQGLVGAMLSLVCAVASADALIVVCFNWGCLVQQPVSFSEPWLRKAVQPLRQAKNPEAERAAVSEVLHRFYLKAAEQTPIAADEPGNDEDDTVNGRMDCIDHSTTTKNILSYLQHRQLLRWHVVGPYATGHWFWGLTTAPRWSKPMWTPMMIGRFIRWTPGMLKPRRYRRSRP